MCMDKSEDKNNRFSQKNQDRFCATIFPTYFENKSFLPDGICKPCETVLVSQSRPPQDRRKIKYQIHYKKLAKHVKFLTQHHPEDGENGNIISNLVPKLKSYINFHVYKFIV